MITLILSLGQELDALSSMLRRIVLPSELKFYLTNTYLDYRDKTCN